MIDHTELVESLEYDLNLGKFIRRKCRYQGKVGQYIAEEICKSGYARIKFNGGRYFVHKLAWFYVTGKWTDKLIDHKDNDKLNNRFHNLREANHSENSCNKKLKENKSGVRGVFLDKNRWVGQVRKNGKVVWKQRFVLLSDAEVAIKAAREKHHGEFAKHK